MLNPETSSDSLSVKSKGVRLVSARIVIIQVAKMGSKINFVAIVVSFRNDLFNLLTIAMMDRIKIAMETS